MLRHGGKHDWYHNPITKLSQPVPRHREIKGYLAKHIIRKLTGIVVLKALDDGGLTCHSRLTGRGVSAFAITGPRVSGI